MIKIQDKRLQHVLVPVTVLTLGLQEIGLYTLLAHWATQESAPDSEGAMAKQIGVSVNTLRKYLGLLSEKGFLTLTLNTKVNEVGETVHDGTPMEITLVDQTPLLPAIPAPVKKKSMTAEQRIYMVAMSPHGEQFLSPEYAPASGQLFAKWKKVKALFEGQDLSRLSEFIQWFNTESPLAKRGESAWKKYCSGKAHAPICALASPDRFAEAYVEWIHADKGVPDYVNRLMQQTGMSLEVAKSYSQKGAEAYLKLFKEGTSGLFNM